MCSLRSNPFGTLGTTGSEAIDPLADIADAVAVAEVGPAYPAGLEVGRSLVAIGRSTDDGSEPGELFELDSEPARLLRSILEPDRLTSRLELETMRRRRPAQLDGVEEELELEMDAVTLRHQDAAVEFYHDTGGVTWTREAMLDNTRQYACGRFTRELVPGSLRVYPIKDFGAIAQGRHRFCQVSSGACEGIADFTMVWRLQADGQWRITRVLSYGHRAASG
mgnify:CR=1 FL=1